MTPVVVETKPDKLLLAGRVSAAATIALVAWAFHPALSDSFNRAKFSVLLIGTGVTAACAIATKTAPIGRALLWKSPIIRALWILVAAWGASTLFSPFIRASFFGLHTRYDGFLSLLAFATFATSVVRLFGRDPKSLQILMFGIAAGCVGTTAYIWIQFRGVDPLGWQEPTGGPIALPFGTLGDSTFAGGYIAMSIPAVAWFAYKRNWFAIGLLPFCVFALLVTESRGALVALAAAAGAAFVVLTARSNFFSKISRKQVLISGAVLLVMLLTIVFFRKENFFRVDSFVQRVELWKSAGSMFLDRPILGQGPDTYYDNILEFRTRADASQFGNQIADKPHNVVLERLALTGTVGFGAYLFLWFTTIKSLVGLVARNRRVAAVFAAGLAAYFAQAFFSIDVPPLAMMQYVFLAAIAAMAIPRADAAKEGEANGPTVDVAAANTGVANATTDARAPRRVGSRSALRWSFATLVVAIGVGAGTTAFYVDWLMGSVNKTSNRGGLLSDVEPKINKVLALSPWESPYRAFSGAVYEREAVALAATDPGQAIVELRRAIYLYEYAIRLQPNNIYHHRNLARAWQQLPQGNGIDEIGEAFFHWRRMIELDPYNYELRSAYAADLLVIGKSSNDPALLAESNRQNNFSVNPHLIP